MLTGMDETSTECVSTYGPESGEHTGPATFAVILRSRVTGNTLSRIEPLCYGHAVYEERWRAAIGAAATAAVLPLNP